MFTKMVLSQNCVVYDPYIHEMFSLKQQMSANTISPPKAWLEVQSAGVVHLTQGNQSNLGTPTIDGQTSETVDMVNTSWITKNLQHLTDAKEWSIGLGSIKLSSKMSHTVDDRLPAFGETMCLKPTS